MLLENASPTKLCGKLKERMTSTSNFYFLQNIQNIKKNHNESLEHKRTLVVELLGITSLSIKLREE